MMLRSFVVTLFLITIAQFCTAQQVHFVYLQTENGQPFYVKVNKEVTSSSAAGYLILPKLTDGDYNLTVGFPKREFPEEEFQVAVDKDNKGFLLKNFGEKGWGLFNLESYAIVMGKGNQSSVAANMELQDDPFSKMLASVVKDSTLLEKKVPVTDTKKEVATKDEAVSPPVQGAEVAAMADSGLSKDSPATENTPAPTVVPPDIKRTLLNQNREGVEMVYIDKSGNGSDTIRLFISSEDQRQDKSQSQVAVHREGKAHDVEEVGGTDSSQFTPPSDIPAMKESKPAISQTEERANTEIAALSRDSVKEESNTAAQKNDPATPDEPLNVIENTTIQAAGKDTNATNTIPKVVSSSFANSDCRNFATNDDYLTLRKRLAGQKNNEDMLKEAKKVLEIKCFSTEQIKNLSFLFANDQGKYQFFVAAYPFTSDSNLYASLQSQLHDPYYVNKFKAMIHK